MRTLVTLFVFSAAAVAQSPRELADLNWMEFREVVPAKIRTVLLPTGTMEAHGVVNNCAGGALWRHREPRCLCRRRDDQ